MFKRWTLAAFLAAACLAIGAPLAVADKGIGEGPSPVLAKTSRRGKLKVWNLSSSPIEVWITLDDPNVDWYSLGTVYPGHRLKRRVPRGAVPYVLAGTLPGGNPNYAAWGPSDPFYIARLYVWTLTD